MAMVNKVYPRTGDTQTIYLKNVITNPNIEVGNYTIYNDFVSDPKEFENNNVLYHYLLNGDKLIIGKFCSIACVLMLSWAVMISLCHAVVRLPRPLSWNIPFDGADIRPIMKGLSSYIHALPAL